MEEPIYERILKKKTKYYGETKAAYQFAAEEYARQYHEWMQSRQAAVSGSVCKHCGCTRDKHTVLGMCLDRVKHFDAN